MTNEEKTSLYECVKRQFSDPGLYKVTRVCEWLVTNGCSPEQMGYGSFRELAEDFPEMFAFQDDNNNDFIQIKSWQTGENDMINSIGHPADSFFGSRNIILNDDIIEMTQQSLFALTKILGNGLSVQQMKQEVYRKFDEAKQNQKLDFFAERYTFPIDYSPDNMLVNGIVTKNISPFGKSLYFAFEKTQISRQGFFEKKPASVVISQEDKDKIYRMLTENFPTEQSLHMATVSKYLTDHGVDRMKYGFYKMKDYLAQMPFLKLQDIVLGGVPQVMITIKDVEKKPDYSGEARRRTSYDGYRKLDFSQNKANIPFGKLSDFCNLPTKPMGILEKYLEEGGKKTDYFEMVNEINADFDIARENNSIRVFDSKLVFPLHYQKKDGTRVELTLKPSAYEGKEWFLYFVDTGVREKNPKYINPGKQLESFAFLGSWSNFLSELASKAVDEEWDFRGSVNGHYSILIQYIKYTFSRLMRENKVCISYDKQFAAFNTGLADNHYDDIYACFGANEPFCDTEWRFLGFCTAASGGLGKQLVNYFNPLPAPATYFSRNEDLFFDHQKQLHTDFEHIIIDNIKRLPLQFLYDQFFDNIGARDLVDTIRSKGSDRASKDELYERLKQIIIDNSRLFLRIQNRLKDAIELARKRVRWNYKTAVPSYFPKRDTMSLMLPLALIDELKPDVALVVELTNSGSYQGQTILTLPQAYIDARLVCRLTGDWLNPADIYENNQEAEED